MSSNSASYKLAIPPSNVLYSEILAVTSAMRKNSRWATSVPYYPSNGRAALASSMGLRSGPQHDSSNTLRGQARRELDPMLGFEDLKRTIRATSDPLTIPLTEVLSPFLILIRSPLSTAQITAAALNSLYTFFVCGIISPNSPNLKPALVELSGTISHSRFETGTSQAEETVIFQILAVIHQCMNGRVGHLLGDIEVCEMLETVLTTCCHMRSSEVLRRNAEHKMHDLVRFVFSRLATLDPEKDDNPQPNDNDEPVTPRAELVKMNFTPVREDSSQTIEEALLQTEKKAETLEIPHSDAEDKPFGLASITELLRVLIGLLDPNDHHHTDSMRVVALGILNAAFEHSGLHVGKFPTLRGMILDQGSKYLFLLARSENLKVLSLSLRVISTVFDTMRPYLKLQQELLLSFLIEKLGPLPNSVQPRTQLNLPRARGQQGSSTSGSMIGHDEANEDNDDDRPSRGPGQALPPAKGESRDLMLETLCQLARDPTFMVDIWLNYDCDVNCEDIFERFINFLAKVVQNADTTQRGSQLLCLDILLDLVNNMATRSERTTAPWPSDFPSTEDVLATKAKKRLILTGAARFNKHPKTGIAFLEEHKLIAPGPESLARFLKETPRLDKKLLGEFLAKPDNIEVLKAFIALFDFNDVPVAEAMREMLESFRLPGESQQIDRITDVFSKHYYASNATSEIKSSDTVHVLAFSIIMLNTDQHSPNIKKRMTLEDYQRNLRGVNDNENFSPSFLQAIYDSIRKREIVMPEEHVGQLGFDYAWKELLKRAQASRPLLICPSSTLDSHMFKLVWKQILSAIAVAFTTINDDYVIEKTITGFRQCATLANSFHVPEVVDFIVLSLSHATGLLEESESTKTGRFPVKDVEGQTITVSPLSVKFGASLRPQLAAVVIFTISNGNGSSLKEGWTPILEILQSLFLHSLLPPKLLQIEHLGDISSIPLVLSKPQQVAPRTDGGLLSALSSYLMTPYGASSDNLLEASDEEVEHTLSALDCIASCRLDELYSEIKFLDLESLLAVLRTIQAAVNRRTVQKLKSLVEDHEPGTPAIGGASPGRPPRLPSLRYDPASSFLLEMMTSIACSMPQYLEDVWPLVFDQITAILSQPKSYSIFLVERAALGLLKLCSSAIEKPSLRDQIFVSFDILGSLPADVTHEFAEPLIVGLAKLIHDHKSFIRSSTEWKLTYALMRPTVEHSMASKTALDLISSLITDGLVTPDNVNGLVTILDDFATYAGLHRRAQHGQDGDPVIERGTRAIELLYDLRKVLPNLGGYWALVSLPVLVSLSHQSTNPCREVRHSAIGHFQRVLLSQQLTQGASTADIYLLFKEAVLPLVEDLLDDELFQRDPGPGGMPETRLRASALLCRVFLSYLDKLAPAGEDLTTLWLQILDLLRGLMVVDRRHQLYEAVPESLKNVLLVMNTSGALVRPETPGIESSPVLIQRWEVTVQRMEAFLPGFLDDIIPVPPPPTPTEEQPTTSAPPS